MRAQFYTVADLGPSQSRTPEGFILCKDVPIARTGMMIYGPDETPIKAGPDGIVKIFREEDEVFKEETLASAQGKSVTIDHPEDDVTPKDWKEKTVGVAFNIRRGEGAQDDLMLADLLITTEDGIEAIESGKREVSCGYEADYEETAPGVGRQKDIIINHIALVDQGRCGPRCAVSDRKETLMAKGDKLAQAVHDAVEKVLGKKKARDEDLPEAAEKGDVHVHVHAGSGEVTPPPGSDQTVDNEEEGRVRFSDDDFEAHVQKNDQEHAEMRSRIEALEAVIAKLTAGTEDEEDPEIAEALKEEAPEGTSDEEMEQVVKAKDSRYLGESFQDTVAQAEILVPGIRVPTFDAAAKPGQTFKKICHFRRQALDLAYAQPATRPILDELLNGKTLDTKSMTCDGIRSLFRSAAAVRRTTNNAGGQSVAHQPVKGITSLAELNARNAAHWNK